MSKILIIEDEAVISKMLKDRLVKEGFEIVTESNGSEGLKKAREEKPDLIILDILLPGIDGFKIAHLLKFDEAYKKIPIIMLTARAQESDKQKGKEAGADAYITKPYEAEELLAKIRELLQNK